MISSRSIVRVSLVFLLLSGFQISAQGSPYTATYIGKREDVTFNEATSTYDNALTGLSYDFKTTTTIRSTLTEAQKAEVPLVSFISGTTYYNVAHEPAQDMSINDSGVVVGRAPDGVSHARPWSSLMWVYSKKGPDGTYLPFSPIPDTDHYSIWSYVSQSNKILTLDNGGDLLFDPIRGSSTLVSELIPEELLKKYSPLPAGLHAQTIDDRGDILIAATNNLSYGGWDSPDDAMYILTPPGLGSPQHVPEPSTLLILGTAFGVFGFQRLRGPKRD